MQDSYTQRPPPRELLITKENGPAMHWKDRQSRPTPAMGQGVTVHPDITLCEGTALLLWFSGPRCIPSIYS